MKRRIILAAAAVCALVAVPACSSDDGDTARSTTTKPGATRSSLMVFTPVETDGTPVELDDGEMRAHLPRLQLWFDELGNDDTVRVVDGTYVIAGDPERDLPIDALVGNEQRILHLPRAEFRPVLQTFFGGTQETTPPEDLEASRTVIMNGEPAADGSVIQFELGPAFFGGEIVEDATASFDHGQWVVFPVLKPGGDGIAQFNDAAELCNSGDERCPATAQGDAVPVGSLAFIVDGTVISAPAINAPSFERDQIQISGSFDEDTANRIALAMRVSLPFDLRLA